MINLRNVKLPPGFHNVDVDDLIDLAHDLLRADVNIVINEASDYILAGDMDNQDAEEFLGYAAAALDSLTQGSQPTDRQLKNAVSLGVHALAGSTPTYYSLGSVAVEEECIEIYNRIRNIMAANERQSRGHRDDRGRDRDREPQRREPARATHRDRDRGRDHRPTRNTDEVENTSRGVRRNRNVKAEEVEEVKETANASAAVALSLDGLVNLTKDCGEQVAYDPRVMAVAYVMSRGGALKTIVEKDDVEKYIDHEITPIVSEVLDSHGLRKVPSFNWDVVLSDGRLNKAAFNIYPDVIAARSSSSVPWWMWESTDVLGGKEAGLCSYYEHFNIVLPSSLGKSILDSIYNAVCFSSWATALNNLRNSLTLHTGAPRLKIVCAIREIDKALTELFNDFITGICRVDWRIEKFTSDYADAVAALQSSDCVDELKLFNEYGTKFLQENYSTVAPDQVEENIYALGIADDIISETCIQLWFCRQGTLAFVNGLVVNEQIAINGEGLADINAENTTEVYDALYALTSDSVIKTKNLGCNVLIDGTGTAIRYIASPMDSTLIKARIC